VTKILDVFCIVFCEDTVLESTLKRDVAQVNGGHEMSLVAAHEGACGGCLSLGRVAKLVTVYV
jgi:hypothetical protein